jgi:hypothetical protein
MARPVAASLDVGRRSGGKPWPPPSLPCGIKVIRSSPTWRIMSAGIPECRTASAAMIFEKLSNINRVFVEPEET